MKIEKNDMVMVYDGGGLSVPAGGERGVRLAGSLRPALVTVFTGRHSLRS